MSMFEVRHVWFDSHLSKPNGLLNKCVMFYLWIALEPRVNYCGGDLPFSHVFSG